MKSYLLTSSFLTFAVVLSGPASAQDQDSGRKGISADDIVVTARRVEERLQDVPVAVTALQGGTLDSLGVRQVVDIRQAVAGLNVSASSGRPSTPIYAIRGQRAGDTQISQDPPVAAYVDDAIITPVAGSNLGLFDLENVQVLKGPQGTLFGRNTTGGAILFVTAKPTDKFEGSLRLGYANYDTKTATAVLNIPVSEAIRVRGAVDWTKSDGFGKIVAGAPTYAGGPGYAVLSTNPNDPRYAGGPAPIVAFGNKGVGKRLGSRDELNFRLGVAIDPTDWLTTMTTGYYSRAHNGGPAFHLLDTPNPNGFAGFFFGTPTAAFPDGSGTTNGPIYDALARSRARNGYDAETSSSSGTRIKIYGIIHTDTVELSDTLRFKNIFSYRHTRNYDSADYDGTNLPIIDTHNLTITDVYSEEAQLQGSAFDDRLSFTFGTYYYLMKGQDGSGFDGTEATVALGTAKTQVADIKNSSFSGYAQASYKVTDNTNFTAGFRYTVDTRRADIYAGDDYSATAPRGFSVCAFRDAAGNRFPVDQCVIRNDKSFAQPSWLLSIDHKLNDDTLVYLASRHSYRSGGFNIRSNTVADALTFFNPEKVTDIELGIKSSNSLGGDLTLTTNIAAYYQWYKNIQRSISTFRNGSAGNIVQNAAAGHIYGGEAEIDLRYGSLIDLNMNYAYVKPVYDSYPTLAPINGVPSQVDDYSDRDQIYIPRHQINARLIFSPDIGDAGDLRFITNLYYQSHYFISEDQQNRAQLLRRISPAAKSTLPTDTVFGQNGYMLVNTRVELNNIGGSQFSAAVFAKNLFDKRYIDSGIVFQDSLGADVGIYGAPRTYGAEVTFKF